LPQGLRGDRAHGREPVAEPRRSAPRLLRRGRGRASELVSDAGGGVEAVTDQPKPRRLLPLAEVENRVGLRMTAIYDRIARGEFPRPVRLGPQTVRWVENEIDEWIDASAEAASDQEEIEQLQAGPDRLPVKC